MRVTNPVKDGVYNIFITETCLVGVGCSGWKEFFFTIESQNHKACISWFIEKKTRHKFLKLALTWTETTMKLSKVSFLSRGSSLASTFCVNCGENRYLHIKGRVFVSQKFYFKMKLRRRKKAIKCSPTPSVARPERTLPGRSFPSFSKRL